MTQAGRGPAGAGWAALDRIRPVLAGALIALDFDGTLAPIQRDPSAVRLADGGLAVLTELAERGARVAIVTGREAAVVLRLGGIESVPGLVIEAVYGAERWAAGELTSPPTPASMVAARHGAQAILDAQRAEVPETDGAWLEDKRINMVVHTQRTIDPEGAQRALAPHIDALARAHNLEMHPGRNVLEIRLPGIDKGSALRRLIDESPDGPTAVLAAGDDVGDVPALEAARDWGVATGRPVATIASGAAPSSPVARAALLTLGGPADVVAALRTLL